MSVPKNGKTFFHSCEFAFLGTTCEQMSALFRQVQEELPGLRLVYIDADHEEKEGDMDSRITVSSAGAEIKCGELHHRMVSPYFLGCADAAVINGHHFRANRQIIVCDRAKISSVERRKEELTDVIAFLAEGMSGLPEEYVHFATGIHTPVFSSVKELAHFISSAAGREDRLKMLILAGGRSSRMGEDKAFIEYHGLPHWKYLAQIGEELGLDIVISCRPEQSSNFESYECITDFLDSSGPAVGIYSAMRKYPKAAWLVMACDMPLVRKEDVENLVLSRDRSRLATGYRNEEKGWVEPLITIWESRARLVIWNALESGKACPRKLLNRQFVHSITPLHSGVLLNANDPEERLKIERQLEKK